MWKPIIEQESSWTGECPPDMVANNLTPAYPTHPGKILRDEIKYRGIRQRKLAKEMGIPYGELHSILRGQKPVTKKMADLFAKTLDLNAEPLVLLQEEYDALTANKQSAFIRQIIKVKNAVAALF